MTGHEQPDVKYYGESNDDHMAHMAWLIFSSNNFFNRSKRDSDYGSYGAQEVMKVKRSGIDRRSADRRKLRKYLSKIQRLQGKYKCYI